MSATILGLPRERRDFQDKTEICHKYEQERMSHRNNGVDIFQKRSFDYGKKLNKKNFLLEIPKKLLP